MSPQAVLAPVFVLIILTYVLLVSTGLARTGAVKRGEVRVKDIALGQSAWPARITQISNSFHSQLEIPILFYALVAFALMTEQTNLLFVVLSWVFVALRLIHAYIHTNSNHVLHRFQAFFGGIIVLGLMWILFAVQLFMG